MAGQTRRLEEPLPKMAFARKIPSSTKAPILCLEAQLDRFFFESCASTIGASTMNSPSSRPHHRRRNAGGRNRDGFRLAPPRLQATVHEVPLPDNLETLHPLAYAHEPAAVRHGG